MLSRSVGRWTRESFGRATCTSPRLLEWADAGKVKGETPAKYSGKNDETFSNFDAKRWKQTVEQFDKVMLDLEKFVDTADECKWGIRLHHSGDVKLLV